MSFLCFVQRIFDWGEECGFDWRGRWKDWRNIALKYDKKVLISKQALQHFNKLDLPILLSKHSINFLAPQPFGEKNLGGNIFVFIICLTQFFSAQQIYGEHFMSNSQHEQHLQIVQINFMYFPASTHSSLVVSNQNFLNELNKRNWVINHCHLIQGSATLFALRTSLKLKFFLGPAFKKPRIFSSEYLLELV